MKFLCFGSLNIDNVYQVDHFVKPGETLSSLSLIKNLGGKGANQAIALAKAGGSVAFAGKIGEDGEAFLHEVSSYGVDTARVEISACPTGNAIIQVEKGGQNSILLFGGANKDITPAYIDKVLSAYSAGDYLILQNEINEMASLLQKAKERGLYIVFNPSPLDEGVFSYPLSCVDLFVVNENEGAALANLPENSTKEEVLDKLKVFYPQADVLLTLGPEGAVYQGREGVFYQAIIDAPVVDTTAAGDTFLGYFLAGKTEGATIPECLYLATVASSITVSRKGAAVSIPYRKEVESLIKAC